MDEQSPFGINMWPIWENTYAPLNSAESLGTGWVRILFAWKDINTAQNQYNWVWIDAQNIIINGTLRANGAGYFGGAGTGVVITLG